MSYDPGTSTYPVSSTPFEWAVQTADVTDWVIIASSQTTITGTIEQPKSSANLLNALLKRVGTYFSELDIDASQGLSAAFKEILKDASFLMPG